MFKTIFGKLITIFIVILIIAFTVTGVMLNYFLDRIETKDKIDGLNEYCDVVNYVFVNYLFIVNSSSYNTDQKSLAENNLSSYLNSLNGLTGLFIWIVNQQGNIEIYSPRLSLPIIREYTDNSGKFMLPDSRQFQYLISEEGRSISQIGDFNGFFKQPVFTGNPEWGDTWLTVGKSYRYKNSNGKVITYAVYLNTPVPEIQANRKKVLGYFLISVSVAVFISIILVYIFSLRLSRPLKQIKNAAKVIAGGEFTKRLEIRSRDEIGELAGTFNQMGVALQNLEEMRRGFIANVSHELRTPMTSIRGFIEGILDGTIPPERQSYYLAIVRDETNRLNRLVNDLLDLARMESGEVTLNLKPAEINELVRRCVIKLETLLVKKNITVEADFEEEDMFATADADAIERVLYNLVHNAIKFAPEDGKIKITTKKQKDKITVSVEDNGPGIENSELDMIWDRFYKSDKSRSRDKTGTGLGLAIVKNIINEHNQQIWVESESGKGTVFTFTLDRTDEGDKKEE